MSSKKTSWILELVDEITSPLKQVEREAKLATSIGHDLEEAYDGVNKELKNTGTEALGSSADVGELVDSFDNFDFGGIHAGMGGITTQIKNMRSASLAFLATPWGAALATLGTIGLIANEFVEFNEEVREANMLTEQITQASSNGIDTIRLRAQAMSETFDKDLADTLRIAKNNVEAFDISWEEAFDTIENGFIRGGKANDDYMQSLREYPKLFAQNGFAIQDFQRLLNEGIDRGIYDDKLPDAIKEFGLSVNEQTKSSRDALESAFGKKFTDELFGNIQTGAYTVKDALLQINEEYQKQGVNATQAQILTADLFRGAGEDAGGFVEIMDAVNSAIIEQEEALSPLQQTLKDTADANLRLAQAQDEALNSKAYAEFSHNTSMFWKEIQIKWYEGVDYVINLMNTWSEELGLRAVQYYSIIKMGPAIFKNEFMKIKEEAMDLIGTFEGVGEIMHRIFTLPQTLDFSGLKDSVISFKDDFQKELSDLNPVDIGSDVIDQFKKVLDNTEDVYRSNFKRNREGALAASELLNEPTGGGSGGAGGGGGGTVTPTPTSGSGGGSGSGGRSLSVTLHFTNHFNTAQQDVQSIASDLMRIINDRMTDSVITLNN